MSWLEKKDGCIILTIRVVPRASSDGIAGVLQNDVLKVRIQAPPVEGHANEYLIKYLAKLWKIPRADIDILSGKTGRNKRVRIRKPTADLIRQLTAFDKD